MFANHIKKFFAEIWNTASLKYFQTDWFYLKRLSGITGTLKFERKQVFSIAESSILSDTLNFAV